MYYIDICTSMECKNDSTYARIKHNSLIPFMTQKSKWVLGKHYISQRNEAQNVKCVAYLITNQAQFTDVIFDSKIVKGGRRALYLRKKWSTKYKNGNKIMLKKCKGETLKDKKPRKRKSFPAVTNVYTQMI